MFDHEEKTPTKPAGRSDSKGKDSVPEILPVLPLNDVVLFPGMLAPLIVSSARSIKLVDDVVSSGRVFLTALQKDRELTDDQIQPENIHEYGCVTRLIKMIKFPDETIRILVQGVTRCKLFNFSSPNGYWRSQYKVLEEQTDNSLEITALARNATQRFQEIISLSPAMPEELKIVAMNLSDPGKISDLIASHINLSLEDRQKLIEIASPRERLNFLMPHLNREQEVLHLGTKIQDTVSETFSKTQREFFLREQLKAIQKELGEEGQGQPNIKEIEEKIAKAKMPPEVLTVANKEKDRLQAIPQMSPEYSVVRTYLDWLTELPWGNKTKDILDIKKARKILDEDHYDLLKVKDRVLEFLSVLKLKHDLKGPILCFVGPPGVGKTSLGQSIARALGRKFIRMSVGGVHDEAEIRGHRRTYIGAMPGRILQGLRNAGTKNPVFMIDEVDKIGADFRGDPSSALLEVLDPEQNFSFSDHYLDVPFDLSHVLFITTANILDTVPPALRDRLEVLELSGYTLMEKEHIAKKFLIPKQVKAHGLKDSQISFNDEALEQIITGYTREAGVRNLERQIAQVCRKVARHIAEGEKGKTTINHKMVHRYCGAIKFESEVTDKLLEPGIATGLAWTATGGEILFVEATQMPGKGDLILTGSLGDVMKESARAALSYVRSNEEHWNIKDKQPIGRSDIHIHVPAGATPKDGPSAGVAIVMALVSLLARKPVRSDVAMTGEITLRGKVMPVGGIKEKVLAAARAGVRHVILPKKNERDLEDVPKEVSRLLEFVFVENIQQAVDYALGDKKPTRRKKAKR